MPLVIQGYSDDIVNVHGCRVSDEISTLSSNKATIIVSDDNGGCVITMRYEKTGLWTATVAQVPADDDGHPIPWPIRITHAERDPGVPGYSVLVTIDCPDTVAVSWRGKRRN